MQWWVLVLMLMAKPGDAKAVALTTIHGYTSEAACEAAATGWVDPTKKRQPFFFGAACVRAGD